jgi:pteridine reductase
MSLENEPLAGKVALITGSARRVGAEIARALHAEGMSVAIHYRSSRAEAEALVDALNGERPGSAAPFAADLLAVARLRAFVDKVVAAFGRLDVLVNNASSFYPTPLGTCSEEQWEDLLGSNVKAPFFLAQAAAPHLRACQGCIVNLGDVHGIRPLKEHPVYSVAKAANLMLTRALARELGPEVRVNAVSPGAILWPEQEPDEVRQQRIVSRTALKRQGAPGDIAAAVRFLVRDGGYLTGQNLAVDGGRTLMQ